MDRRMGAIEKVLAELEGQFDKVEKLANDGLQNTETGLEVLVQRAERTDQRISETATTLRGELLAAFTRMDPPKTEPPKITPPPDERDYEIAISDIPPAELAPTEIAGVAAEIETPGDLRSQLKQQTANDDYLSNARRSASEAAALQAAPPQIRRRRSRRRHLLGRNQLLGIGAISIAVILATMGIALSEGLRCGARKGRGACRTWRSTDCAPATHGNCNTAARHRTSVCCHRPASGACHCFAIAAAKTNTDATH